MNISKDSLLMYLEDCKSSGETETAMLIECILDSYKQVDSERAQKIASVRASAEILAESRRKDIHIAELLRTIDSQNETMQATVTAFRKIYEMSVYGNKFFKSELLLKLWQATERFVGSTTEQEFRENNISLLSILTELNQNDYLYTMRNNMINFSQFMETESVKENQEGVSDTAGDNA